MALNTILEHAASGPLEGRLRAIEQLEVLGDRKAVGTLVHLLREPHVELRLAAGAALGAIGDSRAVAPLVSLLRDPEEVVRGEAFAALVRIGQARAMRLPAHAFDNEDPNHPSAALTQIVWPADLEAVKLLTESLADPDPELRIGAAYTLGQLGVSGVLDQMIDLAARDPDHDVRVAAAFALGDMAEAGHRSALDHLKASWAGVDTEAEMAVVIVRALANSVGSGTYSLFCDALKHRDERVRQLGVMGLGRLRDAGALPRLTQCLADPSLNVRRLAIGALGVLGVRAAIEPLLGACVGAPAETRMAVGRALNSFDQVDVTHSLSNAMNQARASIRQAAVFLMGACRLDAGLHGALTDPDPSVRKAAALAIGSGQFDPLLPPLMDALNDADWTVRVAAAEGLKRLNTPEAIPALESRLDDDHPVVRNAARSAINSLSTSTPDPIG